MTDGDGWFRHVLDRIERLPYVYFREFVVDIWGLRGFDVAVHEEAGADFVGFRGPHNSPETEVVAVEEKVTQDDIDAVTEAAEGFDNARAVAVGKGFEDKRRTDGQQEAAELVDADRLAGLIEEGGFYWTFYRWVALSEAEEPDVVERTEAPVRYGERGGVTLGRTTAGRLGTGDGDVVRVAGDPAGRASKGGLVERNRDYVEVGETYTDGIDVEEGETVDVELLDAGEARRVYVLSVPSVDEGLAEGVWEGHAPHSGAELSQPYGEGEVRTMALELLPHDYCYVGDDTDVVVEGYTGARRVFDG